MVTLTTIAVLVRLDLLYNTKSSPSRHSTHQPYETSDREALYDGNQVSCDDFATDQARNLTEQFL